MNKVRLSMVISLLALILNACTQYVPETQHTVSDPFLDYWSASARLPLIGYPLTEAFDEISLDGKAYLSQYFERAVLEYHPENQEPYNVLLTQLGTYRYQRKYPRGAPGHVSNQYNGRFFSETGRWLGGGFRTYWEQHGGLAQFGYPISNEFQEKSDLNGKTYTVQYFERAVFEYHPEYRGTVNEVLLSQLGKYELAYRYPRGVRDQPAIAKVVLPTTSPRPDDQDGDGLQDAGDDCPKYPETLNKVFDTDGCPDTIHDLINAAKFDINQFWKETFAASGVPYTPPTGGLEGYTEPVLTLCDWAEVGNIFYCPPSLSIHYDLNVLKDELARAGDFAVVIILAHEWGHHVQYILGIKNVFAISRELQADCMAGAYAQFTSTAGRVEPGDVEEALDALYRGGDRPDVEWFDEDAHGQPGQRMEAFIGGFKQGLGACSR